MDTRLIVICAKDAEDSLAFGSLRETRGFAARRARAVGASWAGWEFRRRKRRSHAVALTSAEGASPTSPRSGRVPRGAKRRVLLVVTDVKAMLELRELVDRVGIGHRHGHD